MSSLVLFDADVAVTSYPSVAQVTIPKGTKKITLYTPAASGTVYGAVVKTASAQPDHLRVDGGSTVVSRMEITEIAGVTKLWLRTAAGTKRAVVIAEV